MLLENKKIIVFYSNCAGKILKYMFDNHAFTKDKFESYHIINYEKLEFNSISSDDQKLLKKCDYFIYQPFNKSHEDSEYDIPTIKKQLTSTCKIIRVNYYRFRGFWYQCHYQPFREHARYKFDGQPKYFGLHKEMKYYKGNKEKYCEIKTYVKNIIIPEEPFKNFFIKELQKFKNLDEYSDVKMYSFFISNLQKYPMFYDTFHPTNYFFYEIIRQLIAIIFNENILPEKDDFFVEKCNQSCELTNWTIPILPIIIKYLNLECYKKFQYPIFNSNSGPQKHYMNVYD